MIKIDYYISKNLEYYNNYNNNYNNYNNKYIL